MKCPKCSYENKPDAFVCNLCSHVLKRERASMPTSSPKPSVPAVPPAPPPAYVPTPTRSAPSIGKALFALLWGVLLLGWGTTLVVKRRRLLDFSQYPKDVTLQQLSNFGGYAYVRFDRALVDRNRMFYRARHGTQVTFGSHDPRVGFESVGAKDLLAKAGGLIGKYVQISKAPPLLQAFILTTTHVTYHKGQKQSEETTGHRIYAPIIGTNAKLWVVSKWYPPNVDVKIEPFLAQGTYAGTLQPLSQVGKGQAHGELVNAYRNSSMQSVPGDAVAIVDEPPVEADEVSRWYPLGEANEAFLEVPEEMDIDQSYSEGVLDLPIDGAAERNALFTHLKTTAVKTPPSGPVRVIVLGTPQRFADLRDLPPKWHQLGLAMIGIGLSLLAYGGFVIWAARVRDA